MSYNGGSGGPPPGFRPPNLPPFPPNFSPTNANGTPPPPGGFPPFRPPSGFVPPPFPPTLPVGGSQSPNTANGLPPTPARPPSMYPPRPSHPGLGLPPLPSGMPAPPHLSQGTSRSSSTPGFVREVKTTSVFVGSIAPGITDQTLKDLLNACGPLHELKRVSGASGKPQAFGFAAFENPEVVMRCLRCLNGVELPDLTPAGRQNGHPRKALVVKVDEKTREFLDEFEQTLGRSEDDEAADAICRKSIAHVVALLTDPNALPPDIPKSKTGGRSPIQVVVPAHLQDLKEGDLPENQRVAVLDQIAIFRENAARREKEKKSIEADKERFKAMQQAQQRTGSLDISQTVEYGYGTRAFPKGNKDGRQRGGDWPQNQQNGGSSAPNRQRDPQSYSEPVPFVRAQGRDSKAESDRTDEEEEEIRQQRRNRERDAALRDREHKVESGERRRIDNLNHELARRKQQSDFEAQNRKQLKGLLEEWDDDERYERGKDLFYADRSRWRAQRQLMRNREYQEDVRDRQLEEDEIKALERESEEFLKRQLAEMAELEEKQRQRGLLTEDAAPVKLAIDPLVSAEPKDEKVEVAPSRPRPAFALEADDEEEDVNKRKKRTLVKLDYEGSDTLNEAEQAARRNAKLLEIKNKLPRNKSDLWSSDIEWAAIAEAVIHFKIQPIVHESMKEFLGEVDEDLAEFVLEHVRDKKGPHTLKEGLEPVLAEEADAFVTRIWKQLVFEGLAFVSGLDTGTMMA